MKKLKSRFQKLKLQGKITTIISVLILFTSIILSIISYISINSAYNRVSVATKEKLDQIIQSQVECMIGVLQANYDRSVNGEITPEEAMNNAIHIVKNTRYLNGVGYFWADLENGVNAVHINESIIGTNRWDKQDEMGNYFVRDTIEAGNKPEGGFIDFYFAKPNESEAKAKRGFVMKFEPYGWYIGTGNYQEDMEPLIEKQMNISQRARIISIVILIISSLAILLLGISIALKLAKKIIIPIQIVSERLANLSQGNLHDTVEIVHSNDEIEVLTQSLYNMVEILQKYISNIDDVLTKLMQKDLTVDVNIDYIGDFKSIKESLLKTIHSLNDTFKTINQSADQVSIGSEQLSSSAQSLAEGATEQAGSVEELTATIENVASLVQVNADNANKAYEKAKEYEKEAQGSTAQMIELANAMENISSTSKQIENIIVEIEDIASQTNLLSLNAAIEAARAGEAGRGFAVVADQIGKLALDSSNSAENTKQLISNTLTEIVKGNEITKNATKVINEVIEGIKMLAQSSSEISDMSSSQAETMYQIEQGIEQISIIIQANSSNAEETSATSEELSAQAQTLKDMIGEFKLKDNK